MEHRSNQTDEGMGGWEVCGGANKASRPQLLCWDGGAWCPRATASRESHVGILFRGLEANATGPSRRGKRSCLWGGQPGGGGRGLCCLTALHSCLSLCVWAASGNKDLCHLCCLPWAAHIWGEKRKWGLYWHSGHHCQEVKCWAFWDLFIVSFGKNVIVTF